MIKKYRNLILFFIIFVGFLLRFYAASSSPINYDEIDDLPSVKEISLDLNNLKLPLVDTNRLGNSSMPYKYFARLGLDLWGQSILSARLPYVIIGTLTILIVYFFTKAALGIEVALLASLLLSISQYDVGTSRAVGMSPPLVFLFMTSLWIFYAGIKSSNKNLLLLNGVIMGFGFWIKECMVFLMPINLIFLYFSDTHKIWLKNKHIWISFIIAFCVMAPILWLSLNPQIPRFGYILEESAIGLSLNSTAAYLGELILFLIKPFPDLFRHVVIGLDTEFPIINFVLGILILTAVMKSIKDKDPFVRLLVVSFLFHFAAFTFLRRDNVVQGYLSLGSLDWGICGFIPGIILTAKMLTGFIKRHKQAGILFLGSLLIFMFIRAFSLASYPLNCFFPTKDFCFENQLNWAMMLKEGAIEEGIYLPQGNIQLAKDTFSGIYKVTDHRPEYKKRAAMELYDILMQEGKFKESKIYSDYILSQQP